MRAIEYFLITYHVLWGNVQFWEILLLATSELSQSQSESSHQHHNINLVAEISHLKSILFSFTQLPLAMAAIVRQSTGK